MEKSNRIEFRISNKEKKILQDKADKIGLTLSEYSRKILLESEPIFIDNSVEVQIKKIGYNVNQIVRNSHTYKIPPSENLLTEIKDLIKIIRDFTGRTTKVKN